VNYTAQNNDVHNLKGKRSSDEKDKKTIQTEDANKELVSGYKMGRKRVFFGLLIGYN
jgi:hypothetical protein